MHDIIKMITTLAIICGISGLSLSYLKLKTMPLIKEQELKYIQQPALMRIFPNIDNSPVAERKKFQLANGTSVTVFPAKKEGKLVGIALEDFGKGYGGKIGVMVGFELTKDRLVGVDITTMKETPGLGTLIATPSFTKQFIDIEPPVALKSQGGTIDAISGATVSSVGAVAAVANAIRIYLELKPEFTNWK